MPLSEQEQRLLEEMERSLYNNDADFVATVSSRGGRPNYRRIAIGVLIALLGVAAIVTGVVIKQPIVGMLGFVVVLTGALLAISSPRISGSHQFGEMPDSPGSPVSGKSSSAGKARAGGFMDRMNERWDRRQDDHDR